MQFESIEPAQCAFHFSSKFLEGFMLLFSFDMAASNGCRIDKRNTSAFVPNLSLKFYEAVVRRSMWEILLHMCSDKDKDIEML